MDPKPRPYLVVPKLIEQPTWGGQYIVTAKHWQDRAPLGELKIGQSYELFSGSNLSLLDASDDPAFAGELTNNVDVELPTHPNDTIALKELVAADPSGILGQEVLKQRGKELKLLIKFTQAKGNSFQVHIKTNTTHPRWKPKPESWYYFESGFITLGVKPNADWMAYEHAVRTIADHMAALGEKVKSKLISYEEAKIATDKLLAAYDPWQYVNVLPVAKDQLVDLSSGGIHHSWEENAEHAPLGNVLIELQAEAMDNISTFRSFDKGKISSDGAVRTVHIDDYFTAIDRSFGANDPNNHIVQPVHIKTTTDYVYDRLTETPYYNLDKITLLQNEAIYHETLTRYKHIFVQSASVIITAHDHSISLTIAHSCFIPANAKNLSIKSTSPTSELLMSY